MRDGFVAGGQNPYLIVIVQPKILILIVITQHRYLIIFLGFQGRFVRTPLPTVVHLQQVFCVLLVCSINKTDDHNILITVILLKI
jgi:hypothetical protein